MVRQHKQAGATRAYCSDSDSCYSAAAELPARDMMNGSVRFCSTTRSYIFSVFIAYIGSVRFDANHPLDCFTLPL